jgi:hypothetical protein
MACNVPGFRLAVCESTHGLFDSVQPMRSRSNTQRDFTRLSGVFCAPWRCLAAVTTGIAFAMHGGVKWYAPNNRWGLRGEYRFGATKSKDDAPAFFGRETRYVHRVYAAVVINTVC